MKHPANRLRAACCWAGVFGVLLAGAFPIEPRLQGAATNSGPVRSSQGIRAIDGTTLAAFLADVKTRIPRSGTEAFKKPEMADRQIFQQATRALFEGDTQTAAGLALQVGYELVQLNDSNAGKSYLLLLELRSGFRGLGTYVVDRDFRRNLVLEVPHPLFDTSTLEEGVTMLQALGARSLMISGTHRCANAAASPCSGTTNACGPEGPYHVSDAAHFTENFFQEAHRATLGLQPPPVTISLHGNAVASLPDITLSDGTSTKLPVTALVNRLRQRLRKQRMSVGSCNSPDDRNLDLCGSTNVQGRLSNGSDSPCTANALGNSGMFVHIEQHLNIRTNPGELIRALRKLLPESGPPVANQRF